MIRFLCTAFLLSVVILSVASPAAANSVELLNFNYLQNLQPVANFYNGQGGLNTSNLGITFSSNFFGLRSVYSFVNPGSGNFALDPTQTPAIFIGGTVGSPAVGYMNVAGGFTTGINFFYTSAFTEQIQVWSGANGTGTLLATLLLSPNDVGCSSGPAYCHWSAVGIAFSGTAQSVTFSGAANGIGITDITIGQGTSLVPEPSSIYLLGTGLLGVMAPTIRRFLRG